MLPKPSINQLAYHKEELAAFIHFGINTYTGVEWGDKGPYDLNLFNPTDLDTDQWIRVLKETGFKRVILTVKHHDGFVLYPSKYTDYTIANSACQVDLLEEISKSVSKYDMGLGLYLSPWDAHDKRYSRETQDEYNAYYALQLEEILSNPKYGNKGKFVEVWMDGAHGYGAKHVTYDFDKWFAVIRKHQGDINIFSTKPTSVRWIGNEAGIAGDPLWQKVSKDIIEKETYPVPINEYLNHGDIAGDMYSIGECDVSIRSGWFYGDGSGLKPLDQLLDIYFNSVGKGAPLLLNIPPNKKGRFDDDYVKRLYDFHDVINTMYKNNLNKKIKAVNFPQQLLQKDNQQPQSVDINQSLEISFETEQEFDVINIQEAIALGQSVKSFKVEIEEDHQWKQIAQGSTIGFRRLLRIPKVKTRKIRITILEALSDAKLKCISIHKLPKAHELKSDLPLGMSAISFAVFNQETDHFWLDIVASDFYLLQKNQEMTLKIDQKEVLKIEEPITHVSIASFDKHHIWVDKEIHQLIINGDNSYSYVDFREKEIVLERDTMNKVSLKRFGNLEESARIRVISKPGSAVHGRHYEDLAIILDFQPHEVEKTINIKTFMPTEEDALYFELALESLGGKTNPGLFKNLKCIIKGSH